jgi:ATP-dependent protease ClpP protease subunit
MKKLFVILFVLLFVVFAGIAEADNGYNTTVTAKRSEINPKTICPETRYSSESRCQDCHTLRLDKDGEPFWGLKETDPHNAFEYPNGYLRFENLKSEKMTAYYMLSNISETAFAEAMEYTVNRHGIKDVTIEIYSPGGGIFAGRKIVGLMEHYKTEGVVFTTKTYGLTASAATWIFAAGNIGHRYAFSAAEFMFHELIQFQFSMGITISSPADKEDEAKILRHLNDTTSHYIASRSKLTKEDIDARTRKKQFWMTGSEAFEYGLVDHLIASEDIFKE